MIFSPKHPPILATAGTMNAFRQITTFLTCFALIPVPCAVANPTNGTIRSGAGEIQFDGGNAVFIHQGSDKLIIDWESFSIDPGELTEFLQPSSGAAALNRVFSGDLSAIHGQLRANGRVLLINPNGILVGPGGRVDTAGFVASTLDVSDADFLGGGDMTFRGASTAAVTNLGTINAVDGGDIFLIAREVRNAGALQAPGGAVGMAAGTEVILATEGEERIIVTPDGQDGSVTNEGVVRAATAELKASGGNPYALAINNTGMVRATKFQNRGGKLYLSASGGRIVNSGSLRASSSATIRHTGESGGVEIGGAVTARDETTGNGGTVEISGPNVTLLPGSSVSASGNEGGQVAIRATVVGGQAKIDGSVTASASAGDGGIVTVTGDTIQAGATGKIEANGARDGGLILLGADPLSGMGESFDGTPVPVIPTSSLTLAPGSLLSASGGAGNGGAVRLTGASDGEMTLGGTIQANGGGGDGGQIVARGGDIAVQPGALLEASGTQDGGRLRVEAQDTATFDGTARATGGSGHGGVVEVLGKDVTLGSTAFIDASGGVQGGQVFVGGGRKGQDPDRKNAQNTTVAPGAEIHAVGGQTGGEVVLWADGAMDFLGSVRAQGGSGGFVEVSGLQQLNFAGQVDTGGGQLLLDPFSYTIGAAEAAAIVAALAGNNVTIDTTADTAAFGSSENAGDAGDITVNSNLFYDSLNSLTFLAMGDLTFNASVQNRNATGGDVNLVAGWDGATAYDAAAFAAEDVSATTVFGNEMGSVFIGTGNQTQGVAVGSRGGTTNVFSYDVNVLASTISDGLPSSTGDNVRFGHLGFRAFDGFGQDGTSLGADPMVNGAIAIHAKHNLTATAGNDRYNYAQVGHVGGGNNGSSSAPVDSDATIGVVVGNNIAFTSGTQLDTYAQLGQGGNFANGNHGVTATIAAGNDILFTAPAHGYVQLGQGGEYSNGNHSGTATITSARDIIFTATGSYAQLGQGGYEANGNHGGTATIANVRDIIFTGGTSEAYAQLGQGGIRAQGNHSGTATITNARNLVFTGGFGAASYAHLGQGGYVTRGNHSGTITISTVNDITFTAGSGKNAYAQLGQGGYQAAGSHSGDISIVSANDISFTGGGSHAVLGNGGFLAAGNHGGNISIGEARDLKFVSGPTTEARLGHAGIFATSNLSGSISIGTVRDILLDASASAIAPAQIGHGGLGGEGDRSGDILIAQARNLRVAAGTGSSAKKGKTNPGNAGVGHGGAQGEQAPNVSGKVSINLTGDLDLTATDPVTGATARIGHGAVTSVSGDVSVQVGGDATLSPEAIIGHTVETGGAYDSGYTDVLVEGTLTAAAGAQFNSGAQGEVRVYLKDTASDQVDADALLNGVAKGGPAVFPDGGVVTGSGFFLGAPLGYDYVVDAAAASAIVSELENNGPVTLSSFLSQAAFGAIPVLIDRPYDILVSADLFYDSTYDFNLFATGGLTFNASVQNRNATGGDINLVAGWDGATAYDAAAFAAEDVPVTTVFGNNLGSVFIGSGDQTQGVAVGSRSGTTNVFAHDISVLGATNGRSTLRDNYFAQLGFQVSNGTALGGYFLEAVPVVEGSMTLHARNDLNATGGNGAGNYAQVGHVGDDPDNGNSTVEAAADSTIEISVGRDINFSAGSASIAYAQLGNGGFSSRGNFGATVTITTANDLRFKASSYDSGYAQLGQRARGDLSGTVTILNAHDIMFSGGSESGSYAQLGQGGYGADGNHGGTVNIVSANDLVFSAGSGSYSFAQLGQGGFSAAGNHSGSISLGAVHDIRFTGGSGTTSYAQLGNGGGRAPGNHSGTTTITSANDISFTGGENSTGYAQLGQGGQDTDGDQSGTLTIVKANDITFTGGGFSYAQLGNGGNGSEGNYSGSITIQTANDIAVVAGGRGLATFGNGSDSTSGTVSGDITLESVRDIYVGAGTDTIGGNATIGHRSGSGAISGDVLIQAARDLQLRAGPGFAGKKGQVAPSEIRIGHQSFSGGATGDIDVTHIGNLTMDTVSPLVSALTQIGHDGVTSVSGDIDLQTGGDATLSPEAIIGHTVEAGGAYTSGNTVFGVGEGGGAQTLTAAAGSQLISAPEASGGELRVYLPGLAGYQLEAGALLNGTAAPGPGVDPFPNDQGEALFAEGPYAPDLGVGNFGFYLLIDPSAGAGGGGGTGTGSSSSSGGTNPAAGPTSTGVTNVEDLVEEVLNGNGNGNGNGPVGGGLFDPNGGLFNFIPGGNGGTMSDDPVPPAGLDDDVVNLIPDSFIPDPAPEGTPETGPGPELLSEEGMEQSQSSGEEEEDDEEEEDEEE